MRWKRNAILTGVFFLLLLWVVSLLPEWIEATYSRVLYPLIFAGLGTVTGGLPVSVAEILLGLLALGLLIYSGWRILQIKQGRKSMRRVLWSSLLDILIFMLLVGVLGYALWGLNYGRPPLSQRMEWSPTATRAAELAPLLVPLVNQVIELTNQSFRSCCARTPRIPTAPETSPEELNRALNSGLAQAVGILGLEAPALGFNRAKPLMASELLSHLGLAGFYFPWTGEANFNGHMLPLEAVHSMAHEKAHQIGFAREDEANFVGFMACVSSGNAYARYSGYFFAARQLLDLLRRVDREAWKEAVAALEEPISRDQAALREFWERYQGPARQVSRAVNDAHLRLNRVPGGILSYSQSVQLLLQLAAERGNSLEF